MTGPINRLTISMPKQMHAWVDAQIKAGRYGNVSEYFRDLVRRDQDRRYAATNELRAMLTRKGVDDTAPTSETTPHKGDMLATLADMTPLDTEDQFPDIDATLSPTRSIDL